MGPLYLNYTKEPQNSIGNYSGPYSTKLGTLAKHVNLSCFLGVAGTAGKKTKSHFAKFSGFKAVWILGVSGFRGSRASGFWGFWGLGCGLPRSDFSCPRAWRARGLTTLDAGEAYPKGPSTIIAGTQ